MVGSLATTAAMAEAPSGHIEGPKDKEQQHRQDMRL